MNTNTTQNLNFNPQTHLPVMERFYTIQGEGSHQGKAAYFIRLAGCDIGCPWCDVKESWDAEDHELLSIAELKKDLKNCPAEIVVITGGEPTLYDLTALCLMIHGLGKKTHLETSGAYTFKGSFDWICISPKRFKKVLPENLPLANELKVIIAHPNDFRFAQNHTKHTAATCKWYLQPEWSLAEDLMPEIIVFVKSNPRFQISLQVHKYLNIP